MNLCESSKPIVFVFSSAIQVLANCSTEIEIFLNMNKTKNTFRFSMKNSPSNDLQSMAIEIFLLNEINADKNIVRFQKRKKINSY